MITIIRKIKFTHSKNNLSEGGLISQLTECSYNGISFFVRENINGIPSFLISSNERWGDKSGSKPSNSRQTLELFAPKIYWNEISELVKSLDTQKRPVLFNKRFNRDFIDKILKIQAA